MEKLKHIMRRHAEIQLQVIKRHIFDVLSFDIIY